MKKETEEYLQIFFDRIIENSINDQMMEYSYVFPYEKLKEYVNNLCSIAFPDFLDFLEFLKNTTLSSNIKSEDVTQISNFRSCEIDFCDKLATVRRPLTAFDVGLILQNDGTNRRDDANNKYGENHSKGALQLGLAQNRYGYWYLSCLGKLYPVLDIDTRNALIARTILRNKLYANIFVGLLYGNVSIESVWKTANLKTATKIRRCPSIKTFLTKVIDQARSEGFTFTNEIDFTLEDKKDIIDTNLRRRDNEDVLSFYKKFVDQVFDYDETKDHIIAVMVLLKATIDYILNYPSFGEASITLSLMSLWEARFLKKLPSQLEKRRRSTLFSTPFIILSRMSFWRAIDSNGKKVVFKGRTMKTFLNLCNECEGVEIDKDFIDLIHNANYRNELIKYINKRTKKEYKSVILPD